MATLAGSRVATSSRQPTENPPVLGNLLDVPEDHPRSLVLDVARGLRWRPLELGAPRQAQRKSRMVSLDGGLRDGTCQLGDGVEREQRVTGQAVAQGNRALGERAAKRLFVDFQ